MKTIYKYKWIYTLRKSKFNYGVVIFLILYLNVRGALSCRYSIINYHCKEEKKEEEEKEGNN